MSALENIDAETAANQVPRGECFQSGGQCTWQACKSLSEFMIVGIPDAPIDFRPREEAVQDPWELVGTPETEHWQVRQSKIEQAFGLFVQAGDTQGAIAAARQMRSRTYAINRLLGSMPHTDEVYAAAAIIANRAGEVEERLGLNALVEAFRYEDRRRDRELFIALLRQKIKSRTATIPRHGKILLEGAEPAL